MTQEALAAECFGGSFKAANAKDSKLPENRRVHVKFTRQGGTSSPIVGLPEIWDVQPSFLAVATVPNYQLRETPKSMSTQPFI